MSVLKGRKGFYIFLLPALILLPILIPISLNLAVGGPPSGTLNVRTENDFASNPDIFAIPGEDLVAVFLESLDCMILASDTGEKGHDVIPYRYTERTEQTFCWQDPDETATHYMTLIDGEGNEALRVVANGDCVTKEIAPGDYDMLLYHGNASGKNVTVFIVPVGGRSVLSTAPEETLESVSTIVDTDRCTGCDLSGANFFDADLREVDLGGATLDDAILADSNLSGANLSGASLRNADLTKANLEGANLSGADLTGAILINARLKNADLDGANLEGADLAGTRLANAAPGALVSPDGASSLVSVSGIFDETPGVVQCSTAGAIAPGNGEDLEVTAACTVPAGTYHYRNVHIYNGGSLTFEDAVINFWAYNILIENNSSLIAGTPTTPIGAAGGKLTIHLYGDDQGNGGHGVKCKTDDMCGVDTGIWNNDHTSKVTLPGGVSDFFYSYHFLPVDTGDEHAYFGYKTLAVSYGGTLNLFGKKGALYPDSSDPSNPGMSWVRLSKTAGKGATEIEVDRPVDWAVGDRVVLTTTDYLPGHSELLEITGVTTNQKFTIKVLDPFTGAEIAGGLRYIHSGETFPLTVVPARLGLDIKVDDQPAVETRAAVALLSRSIRIVSAGDEFNASNPTCDYDCFPGGTYHFGGHTSFRQGFKEVKVQGVEFYQLGQGGRIGHYPVHFHMARLVPDGTFVKDSSVWDSMTRFITIHASQGVTLARNVGYMSIGHGYYLEDGTEINNKLYSNIGILARAAVEDFEGKGHNPRKVPGILAATGVNLENIDLLAAVSDYVHPTVFWFMNGWNDFQYNMAAGATACGACYWPVNGAISGPSRDQTWESYANIKPDPGRDATAPVMRFKGNYCTTAMNSYNATVSTAVCHGVGIGSVRVNPVPNPLAPPPEANLANEHYYPRFSANPNATRCNPGENCDTVPVCSGANLERCMVTVLDRYTTSFNWAPTNFSAIWLRRAFFVVMNSAITDVQNAGLTFVTGGDYTQSSLLPGSFMLATKNVFIGNTQIGNTQSDFPLASNAGPFSKGGLACDNTKPQAANYCISRAEVVSFQIDNFANNQRLFNIYDGPANQDSNAYLHITPTVITDCTKANNGVCENSEWANARSLGVPLRQPEKDVCILPNAAIAWKQPNGFYYPPAFHSDNLFFDNVDIRHLVIEPLFLPGTFNTDNAAVKENYCTYNTTDTFSGWTAIDRQTILNDDDGSLTGYAKTVSVNFDHFFNSPVEGIECASENSAKTSPYEYVTSVIYPGCATDSSCGANWSTNCTEHCYGVPLLRQLKTDGENQQSSPDMEIRMMGPDINGRINLTANNGVYYIDTARNTAQNAFPLKNIFQKNQTYYMFFVFAQPHTKQTYQFFVGAGAGLDENAPANVKAVGANLATKAVGFDDLPDGWPAAWKRHYDDTTGILTVTTDMSAFADNFAQARQASCQPESFCELSGNSCACSSKLQADDPALYQECVKNNICKWSGNDVDCPVIEINGSKVIRCLGFGVTLTDKFVADDGNHRPEPTCFPKDDPDWNVSMAALEASEELAGACFKSPVFDPQFCSPGGAGGDPTPAPSPVPTPSPTQEPTPPPPSPAPEPTPVPPTPSPEPTPEPTPTGEILTVETDEPPGENCELGGTKIETGPDINGNGVLDPDEITETTYACNDEEGEGDSGGSNCTLAPAGSGMGSIAGILLVYSLAPAVMLARRRFRRQ